METVTVKISTCSPARAKKLDKPRLESPISVISDAEWLCDVLQISFGEAKQIRGKMKHDSITKGHSVFVKLTYEQLGRYCTRRHVDKLIGYWQAPRVFRINKGESHD